MSDYTIETYKYDESKSIITFHMPYRYNLKNDNEKEEKRRIGVDFVYVIDTDIIEKIKEFESLGYELKPFHKKNNKDKEDNKDKKQSPYMSFWKKNSWTKEQEEATEKCKKNMMDYYDFHYFVMATKLLNIEEDIRDMISDLMDYRENLVIDHIQTTDLEIIEEYHRKKIYEPNKEYNINADYKIQNYYARGNNCYENLCFLDGKTNSGKKAQYIDRSKNIRISTNEKGEYNINIFLDTPIKIKSYNKEIETKAICIVNENILQRNGSTEEEIKNNIRAEAKNIKNIINSMDMFINKNATINNERLLKYIEGKHIYFIEHKEKNANYNAFLYYKMPLDKQKEQQIIRDIEIKEIKKSS